MSLFLTEVFSEHRFTCMREHADNNSLDLISAFLAAIAENMCENEYEVKCKCFFAENARIPHRLRRNNKTPKWLEDEFIILYEKKGFILREGLFLENVKPQVWDLRTGTFLNLLKIPDGSPVR